MGLFRDEQDVYDVLGTFFRMAAIDDEMGPEIQKSGLVIQFRYRDPDSVLTIDARTTDVTTGSLHPTMTSAEGAERNVVMGGSDGNVSHSGVETGDDEAGAMYGRGGYFRVIEGLGGNIETVDVNRNDGVEETPMGRLPTSSPPDVVMTMKADIANRFWLGNLNLLAALSRRQIVAKGPIPKILKLLPAIQPAYAKYRVYLEESGRTDLLKSSY